MGPFPTPTFPIILQTGGRKTPFKIAVNRLEKDLMSIGI